MSKSEFISLIQEMGGEPIGMAEHGYRLLIMNSGWDVDEELLRARLPAYVELEMMRPKQCLDELTRTRDLLRRSDSNLRDRISQQRGLAKAVFIRELVAFFLFGALVVLGAAWGFGG